MGMSVRMLGRLVLDFPDIDFFFTFKSDKVLTRFKIVAIISAAKTMEVVAMAIVTEYLAKRMLVNRIKSHKVSNMLNILFNGILPVIRRY